MSDITVIKVNVPQAVTTVKVTTGAVGAAAAAVSASASAASATNSATSATASANSATASATSATQAATSATASATSATNAATQLANATTQANNSLTYSQASASSSTASSGFAQSAVAQAALAATYASSAASVAQQDLSGVTAAALHRSPNAIVATAIYQTREDSDGGAWINKVDASYLYEPLMGTWLGAQAGEWAARGNPTPQYAEQMATNWSFHGVTLSSDVAAAPDGTQTMDALVEDTSTAQHNANPQQGQINITAGQQYTLSFYVRRVNGTRNAMSSQSSSAVINWSATFDLGAVTATPGAGGAADSAGIQNLGGGLFRCWAVGTAKQTTTAYGYWGLASGTATNYTGDGASSCAFWGMLYNAGTTPGAYTAQSTQAGQYYQDTTNGGKFQRLGSTYGALTETFRGNKARPPRMWGIVAEASRVVIYDLLEPGQPMWMVFTQGGTVANCNFLLTSGGPVTSLACKEGALAVGFSGNGTARIDFAKDRADQYWTGGIYGFAGSGISVRNSQPLRFLAASTPNIASNTVNAVAMTTLPDAPVDPVTGLQVPTIAVATAGGVSVIQNTGAVVSSASTNSAQSISITPWMLLAGRVSTQPGGAYAPMPGTLGASFTMTNLNGGVAPAEFTRSSGANMLLSRRGAIARASNVEARLTQGRFNEATPAASLAAQITDTCNTGWMTGDVRRCMFADTVAGVETASVADRSYKNKPATVTGSLTKTAVASAAQLVFWGGFANDPAWTSTEQTIAGDFSDATKWTTTGGASVSGGVLAFDGVTVPAIGTLLAQQTTTLTLKAGDVLTFTYTIVAGTTSSVAPCLMRTDSAAAVDGTPQSAAGTYTDTLTVPANGQYWIALKSRITAAARTGSIDNISVKRLSAPGSAANVAQEPYSADLDFASGFALPVWASLPGTSGSSSNPSAGGYGPAGVLNPSSFPVVASVAPAMNTTDWTKGAGWTTPAASSFSCDGSQTGVSDLTWTAGASRIPGATAIRKWTISVTAINGSVVIYPNSGVPITVTAPGTYVGFGAHPNVSGTAIFRMSAAGQTCSGSVTIEEVAPAAMGDRSAATGPYWRAGVTPWGNLSGEVYDGTTTRTVTSAASYAGVTAFLQELSLSTSGTLTLKVNGEVAGQTTGAPLATLANAAAVMTWGNRRTLDAAWPGSIALARPTATIPTDDQSRFIYQQEKAMFRDGAQVTLPDAGAVVDLDYDPTEDKVKVVSAANESTFVGLVRTATAPVSAGSFAKVTHKFGVKLLARTGTNPGVDVTIPSQNLLESLVRRAGEESARRSQPPQALDWTGGFTANYGSGSAGLSSFTGLSIPTGSTIQGASVSGTAMPAATTALFTSGTTLFVSAAETASGSAGTFTFADFILPLGMETFEVSAAGVLKQEGSTKDYTRLYDGFRERVRFAVAPGSTAWVRINTRKIAQ